MTIIKEASFEQIKKDIDNIDTDKLLIVVDHNVWDIYKKDLDLDSLNAKKIVVWKAPDGENAKTFKEYERCLEFFIEKGVHRNSHLIAIGGGATSDFAGFVAATLLRGISWSIIPTTLLSMVDASIGGKVAINSKDAKNLVGAFHLPQTIWQNFDLLKTLPKEHLDSGKGEILKYAFLDKDIYDLIHVDPENLPAIIRACARYKEELTERDFKEGGSRKILNLGHTIGHAIERIYNLEHGISVMWGLGLIFHLFCDGCYLPELRTLKIKLGMDDDDSPWFNKAFPDMKVMELIQKDKKLTENESLDLILLDEIGAPKIVNKKIKDIEDLLENKKYELRTLTF